MKTKIIAQDIDKMDIQALLTANNFAGKIAVVYRQCDNHVADVFAKAIERSGNFLKRVAYPDDVLVNAEALSDLLGLPDEIRFVIAIGGRSISQLVSCCERDYILILTQLNTAEYIAPKVMLDGSLETLDSKPPTVVCINKASITANAQDLAKAYACIIAHYAILPDLWFNGCFGALDAKYAESLSKTLQRVASKPIERNSLESVERIIKTNIELAELNAGCSVESVVFNSARLAVMDITQELDAVELGALWTIYIYNYLAKILPIYHENINYPAQLDLFLDELSARSGISSGEIVRLMPRIELVDILTRDYVLIEYKTDLADKLRAKLDELSIALKQLKRLYDDAGQKLSGAIKVDDIKSMFLSASLLNNAYTLPKHLCLMGILS